MYRIVATEVIVQRIREDFMDRLFEKIVVIEKRYRTRSTVSLFVCVDDINFYYGCSVVAHT